MYNFWSILPQILIYLIHLLYRQIPFSPLYGNCLYGISYENKHFGCMKGQPWKNIIFVELKMKTYIDMDVISFIKIKTSVFYWNIVTLKLIEPMRWPKKLEFTFLYSIKELTSILLQFHFIIKRMQYFGNPQQKERGLLFLIQAKSEIDTPG